MSTLLCIHGWPMSSATFNSLVDALPHVNVVSPDLPGFGGTSDNGFDHSMDAYADSICELAATLHDPIHLLGLSMGGKIALHIAARKPRWLQSLVLLAPSYPDASIVCPDALRTQLDAFGNSDALTALVSGWASDTEPLVVWAQLARRGAYDWWLMDGRPADISADLESITAPTLVLHGETDPLRTPDALRERVVDRLPNAELMVVARASHCIHMDQPDVTAGLIQDWMTRHDA